METEISLKKNPYNPVNALEGVRFSCTSTSPSTKYNTKNAYIFAIRKQKREEQMKEDTNLLTGSCKF